MSAAEDNIYQIMLKMGAVPKGIEDDSPGDTDEKMPGGQPDPYPDPSNKGQEGKGTINAHWGDVDHKPDDPAQTSQHHTNAVLDEFARGREKFLQRYFDAYGTSGETSRKLVAQNLEHASSGDYETSAAMLRSGSKRTPAVSETVLEKTRRALDKY